MGNEILHFWQHLPEKMTPIIFEIGPVKPTYYGLMYIIAFAVTYFMVCYRIRHETCFAQYTMDHIKALTTQIILGLIVGARLGYVLFYNPAYYWQHPLEIFLPFEFSNGMRFTGISGMSYHGGLIGILFAGWLYVRRNKLDFLLGIDLYVPVIPLGYTFGRLGNFINGELYGRITSSPIGMYFPLAPTPELRHPSQLYEAFFEGIFLFLILWPLRHIAKPKGAMLAFYLIGYGSVRYVIEFFRQPDAHLGQVILWMSMGQILCAAMIIGGGLLYFHLQRRTHQKA